MNYRGRPLYVMSIRVLEKPLTFFFDAIFINVAFIATFWLRYKSGYFPECTNDEISIALFVNPMLVLMFGWLLIFFFNGLYREWHKESRLDEFFVIFRCIAIGILGLFFLVSAEEIVDFAVQGTRTGVFASRKVAILGTYGLSMLIFATLHRFAIHSLFSRLFIRGIGVSKVLIIGANNSGKEILDNITRYPKLGYRVVGFIDDDGRKKNTDYYGYPVLGTFSDIPNAVSQHQISGIIISHLTTSANEILKIIDYCGNGQVTIYMVPSLMDVIAGHFNTNQIFGVPLIVLLQQHMPAWQAQIKRIIDIIISLIVLILGAPVLLLFGALVRLTTPGPALYKQTRVGQNGTNFTLVKFRSMYIDAEDSKGAQWATENDPRITPVGRFMRKTRIDELPQFINVLKGEMSLVGPRPERPEFIEELKKEIPWYVRRLKMKPGITGWAQVKHKYDETIEDVKEKVRYDLYYFNNMSLSLDLKILIRTIYVVLTGKGAR